MGYAALAGLVAAGMLTHIDRWAVEHAMPGADLHERATLAAALVPLWDVRWHGAVHVTAELVTLPASFTPALVIVTLACLRLRGPRAAAIAVAFVAGNAIEVLTKETLTRPSLHVAVFSNSYPSGHTIRTVVVAWAVSAAWPPARTWAAAWAAASVALIEVGGLHVPSDVAGGLLLAAALVATTASRAWPAAAVSIRRTPWRACRPSARGR
jgi:membrane-associated phospholipid phosphatase